VEGEGGASSKEGRPAAGRTCSPRSSASSSGEARIAVTSLTATRFEAASVIARRPATDEGHVERELAVDDRGGPRAEGVGAPWLWVLEKIRALA
jgi:hypothetical protein